MAVVTLADVDSAHGRPAGTARKRFNDNKKHFIEGEDYFIVNQASEIRTLGIERPQGGTPSRVIVFTESGYLMIVKSFTDDLSWSVQRQLIKTYFRVSEINTSNNDVLIKIIENQKLLERKIDMLEKNSKSRTDDILKMLFDMSSNVISNGMQIIYDKLSK